MVRHWNLHRKKFVLLMRSVSLTVAINYDKALPLLFIQYARIPAPFTSDLQPVSKRAWESITLQQAREGTEGISLYNFVLCTCALICMMTSVVYMLDVKQRKY